MSNYDFTPLSPTEFERLSRDLLARLLGLHLESFKPGRDGGFDARFQLNGTTLMIQSKHYVRSGFSHLRSVCIQKELVKVRARNPTRYIITTSVPLSPHQKESLAQLFAPWCVGPTDIFGQDDLNALLRDYPEVERAHFKLWLTSSAVLDRVLNADVYARGTLLAGDLRRRLSLYVPNDSLHHAETILSHQRYCVITGIPGIGKTTLAEVICARHIEQGYQIVVLGSDAAQAFQVYRESSKQFFYYDDFLGQTAMGDKLNPKEDGELVRLISAVRNDKNKRLLLTTREYILNQALRSYERLSRAGLNDAQCVVSIGDYTRKNRAEILYNHLYHKQVNEELISELVAGDHHKKIIDHPNYSPRVIDAMCEVVATKRPQSNKEWAASFLANLSNPVGIWGHVFDNQLSDAARTMVLAASSLPNTIEISLLKRAWTNYLVRDGYIPESKEFDRVLRELDGTFVKTSVSRNLHLVSLHNPSVRDFVRVVLSQDTELLARLIDGALYFEQVERITSWLDEPQASTLSRNILSAGIRTFRDTPLGHTVPEPRIVPPSTCPAKRLSDLVRLAADEFGSQEVWTAALQLPASGSPYFDAEGVSDLLDTLQVLSPREELASIASHFFDLLLTGDLEIQDYPHLICIAEACAFGQKERMSQLKTSFIDCMSHAYWREVRIEEQALELRAVVRRVSVKLELDPQSWLADIDSRIEELNEAAEAGGDDVHYEAWKDASLERELDDREIDTLFSTLIN